MDQGPARLGAVPLLIATGTGSDLRRPLGMTIIGGLVGSQLLTLYPTPLIYLLLDQAAPSPVGRVEPDAARQACRRPGGMIRPSSPNRISAAAEFDMPRMFAIFIPPSVA